ncbi:MAG TPA: STAS domain-containing protein [Steroidobacteraceae bacterium]
MSASMTPHVYGFEPLGGGRFVLRGEVGFRTARAVLEQTRALFGDVPVIKVDLSGVTETDSAGLALLIEWVSWARHAQREIRFFEIPEQIRAIARISEVEDLLRAGERLTS